MKALLPLAGQGTRMYPLGLDTPKALLPILNKPLLRWTLEALQQNNINEVVLVVNTGDFGQKIRAYVDGLKVEMPQLNAQFAVQDEQKGTAHVTQMAKDFFQPNEEFIWLNGDDLYGPKNIGQLLSETGLAVVAVRVDDPEKYGVLQANEEGRLLKVIEKPTLDQNAGNLTNINCFKLNYRVFELYEKLQPSPRGELELTDTLQLLANETTIKVLPASDYWFPIGYPWHLLAATEYFAPKIEQKIDGTVEPNVTIKGKLILPKSSTIKSGTYIEGNVIVGENTVIGPNAYLRDNVVLGNNCKVGAAVEVKNSIFGNNTHAPHLSYIGDSILGNDVNFAGQSITANFRHDGGTIQTPIKGEMVNTGRMKMGTVIGDRVKLGANTKIYPGRKIWPDKTTLPGAIIDKDLT